MALRKPVDTYSAKEVMKKFPDMAYSLINKEHFQKAVEILYGKDFVIKIDMSKRMQFSCEICNREMNSENAVVDHYRSGNHQKNLDKKARESGKSTRHKLSGYAKNSMRHRLLTSAVKPLGLQMVEEFDKYHDHLYYKCNLCAAHGKLDVMYKHLIGKKHTERYIKSALVLENSVLTNNEREELRCQLADMEGINCEAIKTYYGSEFYPRKWEAEGIAVRKNALRPQIKKEYDSASSDPSSPVPSRSQSPVSQTLRARKENSVEVSPKRIKTSPRSSRKSETPERSPRRHNRSPSLSRFRNRSPPQECIDVVKAVLGKQLTAPAPPPLPAQVPKKEMKDQSIQKFDLEDLMIHMNFIIKTYDINESDIKTPEDAKFAIGLMVKICEALHSITRIPLDDGMLKSAEKQKTLHWQKTILGKIMGYLKFRMEDHLHRKYNI